MRLDKYDKFLATVADIIDDYTTIYPQKEIFVSGNTTIRNVVIVL